MPRPISAGSGRPKMPQWQLQILAAQKRDNEIRREDELKKVASYFEKNTNRSKHHEQWTDEEYYEKAARDAALLSERKIKAAQLEERRKKLEKLFFQEHMEYQQELKALSTQPKLFKNGSFLNKVPTSTLESINIGIMQKEEQLRKHEAELKLHHAWRLQQPELRAATSYFNQGKLKSAWMEQIVEKEMEKKKEEEEMKKTLQERDEALRRQIEIEEEKLRQKEAQMKELRSGLEDQIAELSAKETYLKKLREQEERERMILDRLQLIAREREGELKRLTAERDAVVVNMGLHKYKLKRKVISVLTEIEFDLAMLEKIRRAVLKDLESERDNRFSYKRVLDEAKAELEEYRERERQRQKNIDAMFDGEARQINEKQDKLWEKECEARSALMREVLSTLKRQVEEKIQLSREQQKQNVLEREQILEQMDSFHKEVRASERDNQLKNTQYSAITALQSQLNSLRLQQQQMEAAAEKEKALRDAVQHESKIRKEIAKMQREGSTEAWT